MVLILHQNNNNLSKTTMKKDNFISTGYEPNNKNHILFHKKNQLNNIPNQEFRALEKIGHRPDKKIIRPSFITNTQFPPAIKQWVNSIYSFNQNYTKNLPAADNIVNKIIKSFFTINPLANNPGGKKSRLLERRYKRLSLNKILVSKSEIKHNNDKVIITVHLFNKKKRSLLYKLNHLYKTISLKKFSLKVFNKLDLALKNKNNPNTMGLNGKKDGALPLKHGKLHGNSFSNSNSNILFKHSKITLSFKKGLSNMTIDKRFFMRKKVQLASNRKKILYYKTLKNLTRNSIYKFFALLNRSSKLQVSQILNNLPSTLSDKGNVNNVPANTEKSSILSTRPLNTSVQDLNLKSWFSVMRNNYSALNKYKLWGFTDNNTNNLQNKVGLGFNTKSSASFIKEQENALHVGRGIPHSQGLPWGKKRAIYSTPMYKLKVLYKLFTLYNNINSHPHNAGTLSLKEIKSYDNKAYSVLSLNNTALYSSKILFNTHKLLNKSYIKLKLLTSKESHRNSKINSTLPLKKILNIEPNAYFKNKRHSLKGSTLHSFDKKSGVSLKTMPLLKGKNRFAGINRVHLEEYKENKKAMLLMNNINKIDRFFIKYKDLLEKSLSPNHVELAHSSVEYLESNAASKISQNLKGFLPYQSLISLYKNNISNTYKLNFIKEILQQELLYIYYIKQLSYNSAVFKNWFLLGLKNVVSKIYNKKVIFNFINLKYIHLNSDILTQAITTRLRNYRKNRVTRVLRKVLKLVTLSKINIYTYDIHSPAYKYITEHFNNFKTLNLDIFKDLEEKANTTLSLVSSEKGFNNNGSLNTHSKSLTPSYTPTTIRNLNHTQSSTINFIKYKSVFGVRLEASGRLTKRSTASRSVFKLKYKGTLKNTPVLSRTHSSVILKNNRISNLHFSKISSKTRNGSFGLKGWINSN